MGTLYVVATPLGNLEDMTLRAIRILGEAALIATEDTRTTGRLLKHFDIAGPMVSYFEHNKLARLDRILAALEHGDVALVSEAGTPLLSDPGYELVRQAMERGYTVTPIPGPSAVAAALSAAGLPTDRFLFLGFLPRKSAARRQSLQAVQTQSATLVFYEAPHRVRDTLADLAAIFGEDRDIAVCRELTKLHEEIWRGPLAAACREWTEREPRGEFTLVVAGAAPAATWDEIRVNATLQSMLSAGASAKDAAREVAEQSGWPKRQVYALALQLK
jgi:16S rRNA (cytidine1402-2'-O)-methyltransferase